MFWRKPTPALLKSQKLDISRFIIGQRYKPARRTTKYYVWPEYRPKINRTFNPNWYFNQLEKDKKDEEFCAWLKTQPLLPPLKPGYVRSKCFFDFVQKREDPALPPKPLGRVVFELCDDYLPITCNNFLELCAGTKFGYGLSEQSSSYKGSKIDLVLGDQFICGGTVSPPVFPFKDEAFIIRQRRGVLGMNNGGVDNNRSNFYMLLSDNFQLQGRNVGFGQIIEGMEVLELINKAYPRIERAPKYDILIEDCGILQLAKIPDK